MMVRQLLWRGVLEEIRRRWLSARRRHPSPSSEEPPLRPFLDETFSAWPFSDATIELCPSSPGIYLLYRTGRLIYIGLAVSACGIRQELESHRRGAYGSCTQGATAFLYHIASDPIAVHQRLLRAHRERYGGRVPVCNGSVPGPATSSAVAS